MPIGAYKPKIPTWSQSTANYPTKNDKSGYLMGGKIVHVKTPQQDPKR